MIGPSAISSGFVVYQANEPGTMAKLRVYLQGVPDADTVIVVIQGQFVGTIALDADGNGSLHLSTRRGDSVPVLQAGDVVDVYSTNTRVLLKGFLTAH